MGRKPKNTPAESQEIKQDIPAASNDETAGADEATTSVVGSTVTAEKLAEPRAEKARKTTKSSKTKSVSPKAKKAAAARKKPGRKPMNAEQKAEAGKARAEEKRKAANMKPSIIVEYSGEQADATALVERAKDAFHSERKRTLITDLKLYVKPEERAAYYVVNERFTGKIDF